MRTGLLSALVAIGYEIILQGETIRLKYQKPDTPPKSARWLIDELKKYKAEVLIILKMRNVSTQTEKSQTPANVNAVWPPKVQSLIDWFIKLEPPAEPFYLQPHMRVIDPHKFFAKLRREIESGPSGPWARTGALQSDLQKLKVIFELNGGIQ